MSGRQGLLTTAGEAASKAIWTVYYFVYFLLTGHPEWKCERHERHPLIACCNGAVNDSISNSNSTNQELHSTSKSPFPTQTFYRRWWNGICSAGASILNGSKHVVRNIFLLGKRGVKWIWEKLKLVAFYLSKLWNWLFNSMKITPHEKLPSRQLPATPKPFQIENSCDSPSYNKVEFGPFDDLPPTPVNEPDKYFNKEHERESSIPSRHFGEDDDLITISEQPVKREVSVPPPAPPPPPAKPIRISSTLDLEQAAKPQEPKPNERKEVSGGIPRLPKEVMAELSGALRGERGISAQRELTQSCHPDMAQWKQDENNRYDRSATSTPWRASSVGPTMRRLEQVVSRLEDSSDNEAQYVFRPRQPAAAADRDYTMGHSVFSPIEDAEKMRERINRKTEQESRPITPALSFKSYGESYHDSSHDYSENNIRRRARTVDPSPRETYIQPFTPSLVYGTAPYTAHTRRSRTPTAFAGRHTPTPHDSRTPVTSYDRGNNFAYDRDEVTNGTVSRGARQWPPPSNATGAAVEKDKWLNDVMATQDDGLITTMCRRVVEKKTEDNWKWRDDVGRLVDEQNQRTWKGELDTVLRDGPNQARHWSRTVELTPSGNTLFQDVSRQYSNDYVVESVIRNY